MEKELATILLVSFILLSGCAQVSPCAGVAPEKFVNCVYINAVTEQNPYFCYEIPKEKTEAREACIRDASDYAMKKALEKMPQSEREMLFVEVAEEEIPPAFEYIAPVAEENITEEVPPEENITEEEKATVAIEEKEISFCEEITDTNMQQTCIVQIALATKNLSICEELSNPLNRDLCRAYSRGG